MGKIGYAHGEGKTILLNFLFSFCRVENSLFGFLSELLVFCGQKSKIVIRSFPKSDSLFCSCCSFVKNDESKLLPLLFKKERQSEEQREWFVLGHKKGKSSKMVKWTNFFWVNHSFLESERANHSSRSRVTRASRSHHSFVKSDKSKSLMVTLF